VSASRVCTPMGRDFVYGRVTRAPAGCRLMIFQNIKQSGAEIPSRWIANPPKARQYSNGNHAWPAECLIGFAVKDILYHRANCSANVRRNVVSFALL
jgi:hypothetical protein